MLLEGKTIIVTGGNSGIGEAIVIAAAAEGANVVVDYVIHPEATTELLTKVTDSGGRAVGIDADVSKLTELQSMVDFAVTTFGSLDVIVNNAGVETRTSVLDTTEEQYQRVMDVNLKSAFFGTQFAAQQFIKQGTPGLIINISSVHEDWPMPGNAAYCVSKGGTRMLTRTAGVELGPHGIRVVNVAPSHQHGDHERPGRTGQAGCRHPARSHGAAGRDCRHSCLPRLREIWLHDRHDSVRRRRHHAEQRRALSACPRQSTAIARP
jgi:glucose 1-dehydrogenase